MPLFYGDHTIMSVPKCGDKEAVSVVSLYYRALGGPEARAPGPRIWHGALSTKTQRAQGTCDIHVGATDFQPWEPIIRFLSVETPYNSV